MVPVLPPYRDGQSGSLTCDFHFQRRMAQIGNLASNLESEAQESLVAFQQHFFATRDHFSPQADIQDGAEEDACIAFNRGTFHSSARNRC